jgi:hypothetical protein
MLYLQMNPLPVVASQPVTAVKAVVFDGLQFLSAGPPASMAVLLPAVMSLNAPAGPATP